MFVLDRIIRLINEEKFVVHLTIQFFIQLIKDPACDDSVFSTLVIQSMNSFLKRKKGIDLLLQVIAINENDQQNDLLYSRIALFLVSLIRDVEVYNDSDHQD